MEISISEEILAAWGFSLQDIQSHKVGSGHINGTFLITDTQENKFILQKINHQVFKKPEHIAANLKVVSNYLKSNAPDYLFISPIPTLKKEEMAVIDGQYWRLLPYVPNAVAFDVLSDPKQAFEAAKQFGKLSRLLNACPIQDLQETIPGFHDLALRVQQFHEALEETNQTLKESAKGVINMALKHMHILKYYQSFANSKKFPNRIMHHDTKISNVLLDEHSFDGICVIDLDTLMPGKYISDLGDMMRTYLCAFSENETDFSKLKIRFDYFESMMMGYLSEVKSILTEMEKDFLLFSGKYIIFMQAVRFLTDYLNGSVYYPINYPNQNLDRAINQFTLLSELYYHEKTMQDIIEKCLKKA